MRANPAVLNGALVRVCAHARMRALLLMLCLTACSDPAGVTTALVAAEAATVTVFGRGVADIGISAITGRDCSIVYLDRRQSYCRVQEPPPAPPPYCTRSLGVVDLEPDEPAFCTRSLGVADCWADPANLPPGTRQIADTPPPTREQTGYRNARWPKSLTAGW